MKKLLLLVVLIIGCKISFGQTTPQEISNKFFALYQAGDCDRALDYLFSKSPYSADISEGIDDLKRKLKKTYDQLGKFYGTNLLATRTAGPNLIMFTYLVRHDREPLVFKLMYYKPKETWHMQNFKFGNDIDDELEEASKAYRMKENYN